MDQKKEKAQGCACEGKFEEKIDKMVKDAKKPSVVEHIEKKKEVEDAFKADDKSKK